MKNPSILPKNEDKNPSPAPEKKAEPVTEKPKEQKTSAQENK